ncbi:MAG: hypothetical protein Fur0018_17780 [Anaerolineales bacterium]
MKRILFALVLLLTLIAPLQPSAAATPQPSAPSNGLTLTFETPAYRLENQADGTWRLSVPEAALSSEPGYPQLPVYNRLVAVPPQGAVSLEIVAAQGKALKGRYSLPIAPQPAPLTDDVQPGTWRAALARLNVGQPYPPVMARIAEEAWVRNQRVVRVEVFPFQYRAGTLTWFPQVQVRLHFAEGAAALPGDAPPALSDNPLESSLKFTLTNYEQGKAWRSAAPPIVSASSSITSTAYRISVAQDGLYRLTYADLQAAGMPVNSLNPADFRMSNQGRDVAYAFEGDADTLFEPGEAILFFGEKFHGDYLAARHASDMQNWLALCLTCSLKGVFEKYTDENVYWLFTDGGGTRMSTLDGTPTDTATVPSWYPATAHAEENHEWYSHHFSSEDTWFWTRKRIGYSTVTLSYPITLTNVAATATLSATLSAAIAARSSNVTHHTSFQFNGSTVHDAYWYGKGGYDFTANMPTAGLLEGVNTLDFVIDASGFAEDMYFNWFEVTYPHQFVAQNDALLFDYPYPGRWQFTVDGLNSAAVYVLDVSNPLAPLRILNPRVTASSGGYLTKFEANSTSQGQFLLAADTAIRTPPVTRYDPVALTPPAGGADYLFITHHALLTSTQQLAAYRQSQGLSTFVVDVDKVYNQYNFGIYHPVAIRDYLADALTSWSTPPTYVLLVGEGNLNLKNYESSYGTEPILMPPNLAFVDPWQGEVDATNLLAAVAGNDILPDVAIGRLLVSTPAEFDTVFQKIVDYESAPPQPWQNTVTFVSDNIPDAAGNFEALTESVINGHIPAGMNVQRIYATSYCGAPTNTPTPCPDVNHVITTTLNTTGTFFLNYIGHASLNRWAHEQIFVNANVNDLTNRQQLPVVLSMTCLDGFWLFPNASQSSLQEDMLRAPNGGSVAAFSPTGLGVATGHDYLNRGFYDAVFQNNATLGAASIAAKFNLFASGSNYDLIETFTIFGDPALRFPLPLTLESADTQQGAPGDDLTYRLWVRNTTPLTQTLSLTLSDVQWPTIPLTQTTPSLPPGAGTRLTVTVTVPLGAYPPQQDVLTATLRATSDGSTLGAVRLTSTVIGARGVNIGPASSAQQTTPGETVTYTLALTNTGSLTDTYTVVMGTPVWHTSAPGSIGPVSPGERVPFTITVQVPADAADGITEHLALSAVSQADPLVRASVSISTTARWHRIYLPLTVR